jgi:hypothetical protein
MSFGKSLPSFFHLMLCLPLYGMRSIGLLIKFVSIKGKTVVVDVVVVVVDDVVGSLSLELVKGDGIVLRNDSAT